MRGNGRRGLAACLNSGAMWGVKNADTAGRCFFRKRDRRGCATMKRLTGFAIFKYRLGICGKNREPRTFPI